MRLLSQGQVILRLFELYEETKILLGKINSPFEAFCLTRRGCANLRIWPTYLVA